MTSMTKQQYSELRQRLLSDKERLENQLVSREDTNKDLSLRDSTGELSAADNHPADVGTEVFERGRDLAIQETLERELEQIDAALQRMDQGEYGTCAECGREIPYERLEALPYTAYCLEHTPRKDINDNRPVEEDVMTPPHQAPASTAKQPTVNLMTPAPGMPWKITEPPHRPACPLNQDKTIIRRMYELIWQIRRESWYLMLGYQLFLHNQDSLWFRTLEAKNSYSSYSSPRFFL